MSAIYAQAARDWAVMRAAYDDYLEAALRAAERDTNGNLLNAAGRALGIDPRTLFTGPRSRADRYASEELRDHWLRHRRITLAEYERQWVRAL